MSPEALICPGLGGVESAYWMTTVLCAERITSPVPKRYPAELRRKVLDLVAAGRPVAQVSAFSASTRVRQVSRRRMSSRVGGSVPA